jgi:metal-sulfur cluster biosynthetic enzyme
MTRVADVLDALAGVRDPELDESLVELGFVAGVELDGGHVGVRLRLPTYFCAPNFALMMVEDSRAAVAALPGVGTVHVDLEDHFASDEMDAVVEGLDELRTLFRRKALMARQGRLLAAGARPATLGELHGPDADRCRELRRELGIDARDDAPAFVTGDGAPVTDFARFERLTRLISTSLEGNAGLCRSLLNTRYELEVAA